MLLRGAESAVCVRGDRARAGALLRRALVVWQELGNRQWIARCLAQLAAVKRRPAAGYLEGFQSAVTAIKANEAAVAGQRLVYKPEWYQLG